MKTLNAGYDILTDISDGGIDELKRIEQAARVCYKSEHKISEIESTKKFVKMLIERGHEAMLEHSLLSVKFIVDRGNSHELVRHRLSSFAQESTRYCRYDKDVFENQISVIDIANGLYLEKPSSDTQTDWVTLDCDLYVEWLEAMQDAEKHYLRMLEFGASPQIARSVLPNSVKTELVMTANYREWRHFLKLRTAKEAHPQMREVTVPLLKELQQLIPIIFDDIKVSGEQ